jgi:ribosomal protein S18 acetylase RimI-like enzyme
MIRRACDADLDFVETLAGQFDVYGNYRQVFINFLGQALNPANPPRIEFFIHQTGGGEKTGFIAVEWVAHKGDVHGVVVHQNYRRNGYARMLLDYVMSLARERNVPALEAITATDNGPALKLLGLAGFKQSGVVGKYPKGQEALNLSFRFGGGNAGGERDFDNSPSAPAPRVKIMLSEYSERNHGTHTRVIRIVSTGGDYHNLGSICLGLDKRVGPKCACSSNGSSLHHLDLAWGGVNPYLIGAISSLGGDFRGTPQAELDGALSVGTGPMSGQPRQWPAPGQKSLPRTVAAKRGESSCWGGTIYESWRAYENPRHAVAYLKRYFDVIADANNQTYTPEWIDEECVTPSPDELERLGRRGESCLTGRRRVTRGLATKTIVVSPIAPVTPPNPRPFPRGAGWSELVEEIVRWIDTDPFQRRRRYRGAISPCQGAPVVTGWSSRVVQYAYARRRGTHFQQVYADTIPFIEELRLLANQIEWTAGMTAPPTAIKNAIEQVAVDICSWGGVEQMNYKNSWQVVRDSLLMQDNGAPMNSGWTKVASFATDGRAGVEQAIWDSRVATSLIWRADQILQAWVADGQMTLDQAQSLVDSLGLGTVSGKENVGTRPRALKFKWRDGYRQWRYHLRGGEVIRRMVDLLNDPTNGYQRMPAPQLINNGQCADWTVFGVGLVLFMDGW